MNYDFWQRALAGEEVGGVTLPIHEGIAHPGFWRRRVSQGGSFRPVAIWEEDGHLVALDDGQDSNPAEVFSFCCRYPVTEEAYRERVASGRWPDEDEAMAASLKSPPAYQGIGANNPPTDPWQILHDQIETALKGVEDYGKIDNEQAESKAQGLRSRLLELSGDADKARDKLVRPHLDAEKAINKVWMPLVKEAKAGADAIRKALGDFATAQDKARKAAEAERQRLAAQAEKDRLAAEVAGKPVPAPVAPPAPPPVEPVKTQVRGAYGRAASKIAIKIAKVVDYDKAFQSLKTHPELKALIDQLAQRAVKAGITPDGVEVEESIDVR